MISANAQFRTNVDVAQVDAVVTDSQGRHVSDLEPQDFELIIDGQPQKITYFSYQSDENASPVREQESGKLRREDVRRTIVFFVDELHTSPAEMLRLMPVVRKFVREQVQPGDLVSVMTTRYANGIYEQFTNDKDQILAGLERAVDRVGQASGQIRQSGTLTLGDSTVEVRGASQVSAHFMEVYHGMTVASLSRAVEGLRDMPGRKAVVLFSGGMEFPYDQNAPVLGEMKDTSVIARMTKRTDELARLANEAGVTFYWIDSEGLVPRSGEDAANLSGAPYHLVKQTGGTFATNTNALDDALGEALDDMGGYYLLGFTPSEEYFERRRRGEAPYHRVEVKVLRSGLHVRARTGVTGARDDSAQQVAETREDQLSRILFSPFDTGDIWVRLSPVYSAVVADSGKKNKKPVLRAELALDGHDLQFVDAGGDKQAVFDIVVAVYDVDNKLVLSRDQRFTLKVSEKRLAQFLDAGIAYQMDVGTVKPGVYQIRAAVRDVNTSKAGSAGSYLEVPDFGRSNLVASSLLVAREDPVDSKSSRTILESAVREFSPGEKVTFACQLFGAEVPKGQRKPDVEVEVYLYRNNVRMVSSGVIPVDPPAGEDDILLRGTIGLAKDLPAGSYQMQLVARDTSAGRETSQWTDLTLVN